MSLRESEDTRIDREGAAATRVFESRTLDEERRLGKRQMCFFSRRKGGKRKKGCRHRERERPYIRGPAYNFHSHATRIMRMGSPFPFIDGFLTSSLFPRPRNPRVERFIKGGDRETRQNIFHPADVTKVPLLLIVLSRRKSYRISLNRYFGVSEIN